MGPRNNNRVEMKKKKGTNEEKTLLRTLFAFFFAKRGNTANLLCIFLEFNLVFMNRIDLTKKNDLFCSVLV